MAANTETPKLACLPNGPYYLLNEAKPTVVANLRRQSGAACATVRGVALCRCGGSKNKPFCDGTHSVNGFKDKNTAAPARNRRVAYAGKRVTIYDNRALCAHAGFCTDNLKKVFRQNAEPWIEPDGAAVAEVVETIERCPSGALAYAVDGVEGPRQERPPLVLVTDNGPYAVSGAIELVGVGFGDGASTEHYTLCRCGASANKPFCDGSHWRVDFRDP
jgi:CDGSH-type Zn-finger protein